MKTLITAILTLTHLMLSTSMAAEESSGTYCSSFLRNVQMTFSEGIEYIEQSEHHLAYDSFGETLMRLRAESKYLKDCGQSQKNQMIRLKEESARTLTALYEQIH